MCKNIKQYAAPTFPLPHTSFIVYQCHQQLDASLHIPTSRRPPEPACGFGIGPQLLGVYTGPEEGGLFNEVFEVGTSGQQCGEVSERYVPQHTVHQLQWHALHTKLAPASTHPRTHSGTLRQWTILGVKGLERSGGKIREKQRKKDDKRQGRKRRIKRTKNMKKEKDDGRMRMRR